MLSEDIWEGFHYRPDDALTSTLNTVDSERDAYAAQYAEADSVGAQLSLQSYREDFLARFTAHSAAIEGSTLSIAETRAVIDGEFIPQNKKEVADMLSAKGIAEGYQWGLDQLRSGRDMDADFIRDIHLRTALDIHADARGVFRSTGVIVTGAAFTPPPAHEIYQDMPYLFHCYNESSQHPLIAASVFHIMFERLHPFYDGNGRTGRTLLNLMLTRHDYTPIAVKNSGTREYISALADWDTARTPASFVSLVTEEIRFEMRQQLTLIAPPQQPVRIQGKSEIGELLTERSAERSTTQSRMVSQNVKRGRSHTSAP